MLFMTSHKESLPYTYACVICIFMYEFMFVRGGLKLIPVKDQNDKNSSTSNNSCLYVLASHSLQRSKQCKWHTRKDWTKLRKCLNFLYWKGREDRWNTHNNYGLKNQHNYKMDKYLLKYSYFSVFEATPTL